MSRRNARSVKSRDLLCCGGGQLLPIAVGNAAGVHIADQVFVFLCLHAPLQRGIFFKTGHRRVLAHQGKQHAAARKALGDEIDRPHRVFDLARQDQVADQHARDKKPVFIQPVRPGLAEHLADGRRGRFGIILRSAAACGKRGVGILVIRHVDLHQSLKCTQRLHALVAGAVPHHRNAERQPVERPAHGADIVRRRHQIDAVHAFVPQTQHDIAQSGGVNAFARLHTAADLAVLAIDAAQVAAREKDRAGPARAGETGLFPKVRRRTGDARQRRRSAHAAGLFVPSERAASARTVAANKIHFLPLFKIGKLPTNCTITAPIIASVC